MDNRQIAAAFRDVHEWWRRWEDRTISSDNLDQAANQGYAIIRKYDADDLVVHMVNDLMQNMEKNR